MHVAPSAVHTLPNARLFDCRGRRAPRGVEPLREPQIRDDRSITHQPHARRAHGRVTRSAGVGQVEIELVEGETFDELAARFRLEGRQVRRAQTFVRRPIVSRDAREQIVVELEELAFVLFVRPSHGAHFRGFCVGRGMLRGDRWRARRVRSTSRTSLRGAARAPNGADGTSSRACRRARVRGARGEPTIHRTLARPAPARIDRAVRPVDATPREVELRAQAKVRA